MKADVAVVGLGAMGSMALWRLAARGVDVVGFDMFDPPHTLGSTHGESRIFRLSAQEGAGYVPLVERASELWDELAEAAGVPLLTRTGFLQIDPRGGAAHTVAVDGLRARGLAVEILDADAIRSRFPAHRVDAGDVGLFDPRGGCISPEDAVRSALEVAEAAGARVVRNSRVSAAAAGGGGAVVTAASGEWHVRHVINTTGGWLGDLVPAMSGHITVERRSQVWLELADPTLYTPERFPVFIRNYADSSGRYGFPSADGRTVKLAVHHDGAASPHPDAVDRVVHTSDADGVRDYAERDLIGVTPTVVRVALCTYPNAPDLHFTIGSPPGMEWCTVVGTTSGHGFKFAPTLGEVAAELATTGTSIHPIQQFDLARFSI